MRSVAEWQTIWEFSGYRIVADMDGRYTIWTVQGPLVSFRGRNGLREAYQTAACMAKGEVVYG